MVLSAAVQPTIEAYIDAAYGVHTAGKSHSAMFLTVGGGPILVKSSKQKLVTKSSTEAELVALSDLSSLVIWIREFLLGQGEDVGAATVFQDNMSTIALIDRGSSNSDRTRHVNVRYYWLKDRVNSKEIKILHKDTNHMTADILTKALQGDKFIQLRSQLLNWPIQDH
jgi:tagatose-1,6-bisphosphate aldolase non-catalytic subunit AgaZ/GatZ